MWPGAASGRLQSSVGATSSGAIRLGSAILAMAILRLATSRAVSAGEDRMEDVVPRGGWRTQLAELDQRVGIGPDAVDLGAEIAGRILQEVGNEIDAHAARRLDREVDFGGASRVFLDQGVGFLERRDGG